MFRLCWNGEWAHVSDSQPSQTHTYHNQYCNFNVTYCVCVLLKASHDARAYVLSTYRSMCFNCSRLGAAVDNMPSARRSTVAYVSTVIRLNCGFVVIFFFFFLVKQLSNCEREKICDNKHRVNAKTNTATPTTLDCNHVNVCWYGCGGDDEINSQLGMGMEKENQCRNGGGSCNGKLSITHMHVVYLWPYMTDAGRWRWCILLFCVSFDGSRIMTRHENNHFIIIIPIEVGRSASSSSSRPRSQAYSVRSLDGTSVSCWGFARIAQTIHTQYGHYGHIKYSIGAIVFCIALVSKSLKRKPSHKQTHTTYDVPIRILIVSCILVLAAIPITAAVASVEEANSFPFPIIRRTIIFFFPNSYTYIYSMETSIDWRTWLFAIAWKNEWWKLIAMKNMKLEHASMHIRKENMFIFIPTSATWYGLLRKNSIGFQSDVRLEVWKKVLFERDEN